MVLENGDQLSAPLVVTSLHPKIAFLEHLPRTELPEDFARDIERWNTRSGVVKINLALAELPNFTANPNADAPMVEGSPSTSPARWRCRRRWSSSSAPSRTPARAAPALLPFSDGVIPTTLDKTMNPDGTHIFSMFTQYVPHDWARRRTPRSSRRTPTG